LSTGSGENGGGSTTRRLIAAARDGQRNAAGRLIERFEPLLRSCVRRHLGPKRFRADGEDALQVVRLAVFRGLGGLRARDRRSLEAWIRKVVHNRLLDWDEQRRAHRRTSGRGAVSLLATDAPEVSAPTPSPSRILIVREDLARLAEAIDRVPPRYRTVLWFIFEEDPTPAELALFLKKEPDAARKFVARALKHLERGLGPGDDSLVQP
jgi:RNA polymerase sigma factor (sigma-70 family)